MSDLFEPTFADALGAPAADARLPLEARRGTPDDVDDPDAEGDDQLGDDLDDEFDDIDDLEDEDDEDEDDEDDDEDEDDEDDLDDEDDDLDDEDLDDEDGDAGYDADEDA